jgi:shikimate dehydrogenase
MRQYGLIGYPLSHSFSQRYFTEKFKREEITDCIYTNFEIPTMAALNVILSEPGLCGLNVTIPYKQAVLEYLDGRNDVVAAIGACNCIKIEDGRRTGYNTDVVGFERTLIKHLGSHHRRALVLGTGGASKAVEWVLEKLGIDYRMVSRRPRAESTDLRYEQLDAALLGDYTLIVNTTPVGMYPGTDEYPPLPYEALTRRHYLFDLIYNPEKTLFLRKGEERGAVIENGHEMLVLQAEESWRIWNERTAGEIAVR